MSDSWCAAVLAVFERCDNYDDLMWRVKGDEVEFTALCNDLFWWATADGEAIDRDDIDLLRSCADDLLKIDETWALSSLFAARKRHMRPQRPCYKGLTPELAALFDACGPERDRASEG